MLNTNLEIIISFIALLLGIAYLFSQVRKQDMVTLRNSNDDLRSSINDKTTEIGNLQTHLKALDEAMKELQDKVGVLEKRNKTLEDLVVTALKMYFYENPKVAGTMKDIINPPT